MARAYALWYADLRVLSAAIGVACLCLLFLPGRFSNQWPAIKGLAPFSGIDRPALWFAGKADRHASIRYSGELRLDGFGNPDGCSRLPDEQSRQQREYRTETNADRSAAAWQMSFFLPRHCGSPI
ncbi:MAG: hypothetical protein KGK01_07080 [Bradyrhizobium sp.]|uniref:hypothetical protein n=1 Tax=Bradyrhizobium sp. TaxID=376 RepID=UPI001C28FBFA|nr:hypothetical protein [Bradyrhizobium sp.]MBU6462947.1 hypothetical protein [Pseudomonadota bacterium]MDE2068150.1 hypothetical protein [Bradyrhizobium sp.]MDE2242204.1 hypothetical protein [Bradyrhizobium sp.]